MPEIIAKGRWMPVFVCKHCGCDLNLVDIDCHECPNCNTLCGETESIAYIKFKRFCYTWKPKWYQMFRTAHGFWEYSK